MAKKNGKKLVPKRVGGVKIPKDVRKAANAFAALLTTPEARQLAADVLIAVAGVLAAGGRAADTDQNGTSKAEDTGSAAAETGTALASTAGDAAKVAAGVVGDVVSEAASRVLPASLTGEDSQPNAYGRSSEDGKRKKNRDQTSSH